MAFERVKTFLGIDEVLNYVKQKGVGTMMMPLKNNPPRRKGKQVLDLYNKNPRLHGPISKMSLDIAGLTGNVYKVKEGRKDEVVPNHPLTKMIYSYNEVFHTTGSTDIYISQVHYLVRGESFAIIDRDKKGEPQALWFIPPDWVTSTPQIDKPVFEITTGDGKVFDVEAKNMFYRKNPNPMNPNGRGIGKSESILDEVETDEYMARFAKRFFFNDATPNLIITAPPEADDENVQNAQKRWMQKYSGIGNANKAAFLNWDAKVHILNSTNREMDFIESRKFYRDLTIQHFGIPPEIMGNVENSNKATVVAAQVIYHKEVIEPQIKQLEQAITYQLLRQFPRSSNLEFKFERINTDAEERKVENYKVGYDAGAITVNEWRVEILGLSPLEGKVGNSLLIPSNRVPTDAKTGKPVYTPPVPEVSKDEKPKDEKPKDEKSKDDKGGDGDEREQNQGNSKETIRVTD